MKEGLIVSSQDFNSIFEQASTLVKSGMLPSAVTKPEQAVAIAMKGLEVGLPMMQSFSHIHVISGKPTISAEGMNYLIRKNCPQAKLHVKERSAERCEIVASRPGSPATSFVFTMEDAKTAQLLGNMAWKKYPRNMLFARAMSDCARVMFPDCIGGISYTPEELGAEVDEDGIVVDAEIKARPGFDPSNKMHMAALDAFLDDKEFDEAKRAKFVEAMVGRKSEDLKSTWETFESE